MSGAQRFTKASLQKTLKDRLVLLSNGLKEAEMGNKGIELVKEMKELHTMLENILSEDKQDAKKDVAKGVGMHISFSWGVPEENREENTKSTLGEHDAAHIKTGNRK